MNKMQQMVQDFHKKYNHNIGYSPSILQPELLKFRLDFLQEELNEIICASKNSDLIGICDGIGDLLYVTFGMCVCMGIDIEPMFEEIHRSNMSKDPPLGPTSKPIKGKNFSLPNIKKEIDKQRNK